MNDPPIFVRRRDALTISEAGYFQDLLYRTVKIGTELEFALPKGVPRKDFQPRIERLMEPSKDMDRLGRLGVFDVVKEHCGVEVQIIGRHPHWNSLLEQYRQIVTPLVKQGVRMRPTCGLHFHLIGIGLAETIPEIILANLWNMFRRYGPGLKFLTSGGNTRQGLCRRRQHNAHQEFLRQSPIDMSMGEIRQRLKESTDVPEHQNFFNLEHLGFDEDGGIGRFHIELRFPDGDLSPVSITAKTFLFLVMLLKAVEISKFGLLHVGNIHNWNRKMELMDLISNNDGTLATSDTTRAMSFLEEYRDIAKDLLRFLKSIFIVLDSPSEVVLQALAERPISLRRIASEDWETIDWDLQSLLIPERSFDETDYRIIKIIELGLVDGVGDFEEWLGRAAAQSYVPKETVRDRIESYKMREPVWNEDLGRMVFLR
jgi:hypothetical protein